MMVVVVVIVMLMMLMISVTPTICTRPGKYDFNYTFDAHDILTMLMMILSMVFQRSFQLQYPRLLLCNRPGSQQGEVS